MRAMFVLASGLVMAWAVTATAADLVTKKSPYGVDETLDRLEEVVQEKGIAVMGRIDHRDNALTVGQTLRPTQVLLFGNPALGTQLMQLEQRVGLDLPMRVLAWEDADGQTWIAYREPATFAQWYESVDEDSDVVKKMTGALGGLTDAAIRQ